MTSSVLVVHTGGTIGMEPSPDGYRPMDSFGQVLRETLVAHAGARLPEFDVVALDRPIDSANLRPAHWTLIAETLLANWDSYDGFVVLHGTDTLAWSASALSFMLRGTDKPVIFTGSQIPLIEPRSDALANVETALLFASRNPVREVGVFFDRHLLRGNRASKLATARFAAFGSPNCLPLAEVGIDVTVHFERLLAPEPRRFVVPRFDPAAVAVLTIYPGLSSGSVEALLESSGARGLILRSYGVGNAPDADTALMAAIERAVARGVVVLNTTQSHSGGIAQGAYSSGAALSRIGVIPGGDMTLEASFAKMHVLLATESDPETLRRDLARPLCGELSQPQGVAALAHRATV